MNFKIPMSNRMDKIKGVGCGRSVIRDKCLVVSVQGSRPRARGSFRSKG